MGSEDEAKQRASSRTRSSVTPCAVITMAMFFATAFFFASFTGTKSSNVQVAAGSVDKEPPLVLRNSHGVEVHILRTGASIQRLLLPDKSGALADVVLGFDSESHYSDGTSPYFGAMVGRVANRIANSTFTLDGKTYRLGSNEPGYAHLHGGFKGFDKVVWRAEHLNPKALKHRRRGRAVRLSYTSPDGEEGYPGTLEVEVVYTLIDSARSFDDASGALAPGGHSELIQTISATVSGKPTVLNMAQHSYFNLGGHGSGSVLEHELTLPGATRYLPVDSRRIPTGEMRPVRDTAFDFLKPRRIGSRVGEVDGPGWSAGYDHCFVLHELGEGAPAHEASLDAIVGGRPPPAADAGWWLRAPRLAATLSHPPSGRTMEVLTNAPALQVYTSNFLDASAPIAGAKGGVTYGRYGGLCLETQSFPNGPSHADDAARAGGGAAGGGAAGGAAGEASKGPPQRRPPSRSMAARRMGMPHSNHRWDHERAPYPTGVLRPGERYRHTTVYRFSTSST